jgi:hypothetical protein
VAASASGKSSNLPKHSKSFSTGNIDKAGLEVVEVKFEGDH